MPARSRNRPAARRSSALVENPDILATVAHDANPSGLAWSLALRPKRTRASRMRRPSSSAKGATGSSPMTFRPISGVMGGDRNTVHILTADGVEALATAIEMPTSLTAWLRGSRACWHGNRNEESSCRSMRLPHAEGLPLPTYQSELAAGLDLIAAVPADAPVALAAGRARRFRPAFASRCRPVRKARSGRDPGWRCDTVSPY